MEVGFGKFICLKDETNQASPKDYFDKHFNGLNNFTKSIDKMNLYEPYKNNENMNNDLLFQGKTNPFKMFMIVVTNFSSTSFTIKLSHITDLIEKVEVSLKCLIQNINDDSKILFEITDISNFSVRMVSEIKYNANMILVFLEAAIRHIIVIENVLNSSSCKNEENEWSNVDKQDIKVALKALSKGTKKLMCFSKSAKCSMEELLQQKKNDFKICDPLSAENSKFNFKNILDKIDFDKEKQEITESYLYPYERNFFMQLSLIFSSQQRKDDRELRGKFKTAKVEKNQLKSDKAGLLLVNDTLISSIIKELGANAPESISRSVSKLAEYFLNQKQQEDFYELNKLVEGLVQLDRASKKILYCMAEAEETINDVLSTIETVQVYLENKMQLSENREICSVTIKLTKSMIKCLKKISN